MTTWIAETKARVERFEKGPATINVSGYPQGIQEDYAVFSQKCTQCHKLSRPINSDYALPDEWSRYINRMMNKPGSGISSGDAKKIYDFLVYDASVRKKAMLDSKLAAAFAGRQSRELKRRSSRSTRNTAISRRFQHLRTCLSRTQLNCRT